MTSPLRAVTYGRVSTSAQSARGHSLEEQRAALAAYCRQHGLILLEHVEEPGVSGGVADRPGLRRVRELVAARVVDVVICVVLDRLARKAWLSESFIEEMKAAGVRVLFTDQLFAEGPTGDLTRGILGHVAQFEHAQITERTMAGRRRKAESGRIPGYCGMDGAPYGYRLITRAEASVLPAYHDAAGTLEVVDAEAAVVRRAYALVVSGLTVYTLARQLTSEGLFPRRGSTWGLTALRRLLRNPLYRGELQYYRDRHYQLPELTDSGRPRRRRVPRAPSEWTLIPVPPIVDETVWLRAQAALNGLARGPQTNTYVLRGCVWCGSCTDGAGRPVRCGGRRRTNSRASPGYHRHVYACEGAKVTGRPFCGARHDREELEALARAALLRAADPARMGAQARAAAARAARRSTTQAAAQSTLREARTRLAEVEGLLLRLTDEAISGALPADIIARRAGELSAQREHHRRTISQAEAAARAVRSPAEAEAEARRLAEWLREEIRAAGEDFTCLSALYRQTLTVTLWPDGRPPEIVVRHPS